MQSNKEIELSIVMPCLNEADTLLKCINKSECFIEETHIQGEIIIADNGSTDGSVEIALKTSAKVISVPEKGYGFALMGGIQAASGKFIIMGDADDSYDFLKLEAFVSRLREGYDLVMGCRYPSGGGMIKEGAMPFSHRYFGNPLLTLLAKGMFKCPVHDIYCGLRGFTKSFYHHLALRCTGMEFATEMILKASLFKRKIGEVPVVLWPDGRKIHTSHLKTFRDGWRTIRLFLLMSPSWLYFFPGFLLFAVSLVFSVLIYMKPLTINSVRLDVNTLLFISFFGLAGFQIILFGLYARVFSVIEGLLPKDRLFRVYHSVFSLENGLLLSSVFFLIGIAFGLHIFLAWSNVHYGDLSYAVSLRQTIASASFLFLSLETFFTSFLISSLTLSRR